MAGWARKVFLAPALAAATAPAAAGDWKTAIATATVAYLGAVVALAMEAREAECRVLDVLQGEPASEAELAVAARVGLDAVTLREARAAAKAAVRGVMVRRAAGVAALARGSSAAARAEAALVAVAEESERELDAWAEDEPAAAPESPEPASASQVVTGVRPARPDDVD